MTRCAVVPLLAWVALVIVLFAAPSTALGVVSIDYGTEWIKAALIKPGKPFDLVLSRDSKRKVQASVAFKGSVPADGRLEAQERILGADAYAFASRNPLQSYHAPKLLLGQSCRMDESPAVAQYRAVFDNNVAVLPADKDAGSSCVVAPSRDTTSYWRPEELVGMQLDHMRELAEETAGEQLSIGYTGGEATYFSAQRGLDAVVTVPVFYTSYERQALYDSAILAGFRPRLISDAAAAAANYAQSRSFSTPERHIFYDAGAGSTRATLVEFRAPTNSTRHDSTVIDVIDAAWDRNAGGLAMDMLVRDMLADAFDAAHPARTSVRHDGRAMARLLREANKAKHVLSANAVAAVSVEGLADDLDLRTTLEREAFERKMRESGLLERFGAPLQELLARTKHSWGDVQSVVLVGGATRVPAVQAELKRRGVPDAKLAQNVNADEAAVMGAALAMASSQPQLRMRHVQVNDVVLYGVNLHAPGLEQLIFPPGPSGAGAFEFTLVGVQDDFELSLSVDPSRLPRGDDGRLQKVAVKGMSDVLSDLRERRELGDVDIHVNLTVRSVPLGVYSINAAYVTVSPRKSITGTLKSLLGFDEPKNSTETEASSEPQSMALRVDTTHLAPVRPLSGPEKAGSIERLRTIVYEAKQRALRDEAVNTLEATVYRSRDLQKDYGFQAAATVEELRDMEAKTKELGAWLADEGEHADADTIKRRQRELTKISDAVERRRMQSSRRPAAVASLRDVLGTSRTFEAQARANLTQAMKDKASSKYAVTELDALAAQIAKDEAWLNDGEKAQQTKKASDEPVLLIEDLERRTKKLRDMVSKMRKRRIPKTRPRPASTSTASSTTSTSTSTPAPEATSTSDIPVHDDL